MLQRVEKLRQNEWRLPLLFLALGLGLCFHQVFLSGFRHVPAYSIDPRLCIYIMEHSFQWLAGNPLHADFWSPPIFYPAKNALGFSDVLAGYGWMYWPFRFMGISATTSYSIWMLLNSVLNFSLMYAGLRHLVRLDIPAACTGAYVFAFGIPRMAQLVHPQLLTQAYVLIMVAGLFLLLSPGGRNWPGWLCISAGAVLQFYSGFYHLWFAGVCMSVFVLAALTVPECRRPVLNMFRHPAPWVLIPLAVLLMWPLIRVYLGVLDNVGARPRNEIETMLPGLKSWFYVGHANVLYGWIYQKFPNLIPSEMTHEHVIGLGLITTIAAWAGLIRWRRNAWARAVLIMLVIMVALSWNYSEQWNVWFFIAEHVPGASAIRAVSRIAIALLVVFSAGLAYMIHCMPSTIWRNGLITLIVLEQWMVIPAYDPMPTAERVTAIAEKARAINHPFFVSKLVGPEYQRGGEMEVHMDAMLAGLEANLPVVNGYSGTIPPKWILLYFNTIGPDRDRVRIRDWLDAWMREFPDVVTKPAVIEIP
jgi:hypothetical protein